MAEAMRKVIAYLDDRFDLNAAGHTLDYVRSIRLSELIGLIQTHERRIEFSPLTCEDSFMKPDGGILLLRSETDEAFKRIVLVAEMKRQGTNDKRLAEGKPKQSKGNAIERLGKNLIGIRATLQYERITPFVCFGWGIDFAPHSSILDRVITMNEFYPINRTFVFKKEDYAPVSMFFRERRWEVDELYDVMKEIAETSIRYYLH